MTLPQSRQKRSTQADRNRARRYRIRAKPDTKSPLNAEEKKWLDEYSKVHPHKGSRFIPAPPRVVETSARIAWADVDEPTEQPELEDDEDDEDDDEEPEAPKSETKPRAVIDFGTPELEHKPAASSCKPDCPRCRSLDGSYVCGSTGLRVWEPISVESSLSAAALVLGTISIATKFVLGQPHAVVPTDDELRAMAAAIRVTAKRRLPAAGRWDDLLALGWAFFAFGKRAAMSSVAPRPQPRPQVPPVASSPPPPPAASSPAPDRHLRIVESPAPPPAPPPAAPAPPAAVAAPPPAPATLDTFLSPYSRPEMPSFAV